MKRIIIGFYSISLVFLMIIISCSGGNKSLVHRKSDPATVKPEDSSPLSDELKAGEVVYQRFCCACHQSKGKGIQGMYPPLAGNTVLRGPDESLVRILLMGKSGQIEVNSVTYAGMMPPQSYLSDEQVANVLNYIRTGICNIPSTITADEVSSTRKTQRK